MTRLGKVLLEDHQMRKIKCAELVEDFDIYPRNNVDTQRISSICEAISAGIELPPPIIDRQSKRIIDGFHRRRANIRLYGEDAAIDVVEKKYANESEMFIDAMRYNASHGQPLDKCDKTHCIILSERLQISPDQVAGALNTTVQQIEKLRNGRIGFTSSGSPVALKNTVRKMFAGHKLNKRQIAANERLSGMTQQFYANQLIELIESEMIDLGNERLMNQLKILHDLLGKLW